MTDHHITDQELADRIVKSRWFVQEQCRLKRWPHLRVGKSLRFTTEHVAAIEALLEVKPNTATEPAQVNPWGRKGKTA